MYYKNIVLYYQDYLFFLLILILLYENINKNYFLYFENLNHVIENNLSIHIMFLIHMKTYLNYN